jgi:hypothetical protein
MQGSSQSALGRELARLHLAESDDVFGFPMQTRFCSHIIMLRHEFDYVKVCNLSISLDFLGFEFEEMCPWMLTGLGLFHWTIAGILRGANFSLSNALETGFR